MDYDGLALFLHLSRTLHFTRTSRECHLSLSALSRTIQRLESYVRCARAELASNPHDELLREFIRINETLIREERERLLSAA